MFRQANLAFSDIDAIAVSNGPGLIGSLLLGLTAGLGHRKTEEGRRELVFLVRSELWRPAYTVADQFGFSEEEESAQSKKLLPTDVITGVLQDISKVPRGIAEGLGGHGSDDKGVTSNLGGDKQ